MTGIHGIDPLKGQGKQRRSPRRGRIPGMHPGDEDNAGENGENIGEAQGAMGLIAYRLTELAEFYGVDYATVHRWKQSGKILPISVSGEKLPRYLTKELSLLIKNSNLGNPNS